MEYSSMLLWMVNLAKEPTIGSQLVGSYQKLIQDQFGSPSIQEIYSGQVALRHPITRALPLRCQKY
jgi:hypothetical protein